MNELRILIAKDLLAMSATSGESSRTGLPAEVKYDGAARKRYSVARPERKDLTLYVLRDFVSWEQTSNTRGATPTPANMYSAYGTAHLGPGYFIFGNRPSAITN
ncbi:hypothetical protein LA080_009961 [Diaporthe eres]|nr:hypothetical protein LA080_009961 [Diaporthe eres]